MEAMINSYRILGPTLEESAWETKRRLVENIKLDLKEIWPEYTYRVHLAQDRIRWQALVNSSSIAGNVL
jgi:hypothetical protein